MSRCSEGVDLKEAHENLANRSTIPPRRNRLFFSIVWMAAFAFAPSASGQLLVQNFENVCSGMNSNCPSLLGAGWVLTNHSDALGTSSWFQGIPADNFAAHSGSSNSYIAANFDNADDQPGMDTINNWLISPVRALTNGDSISFWTRTTGDTTYPDRLQLRLSTAGNSVDVGTGADESEVGVFTILAKDINPNYLQTGIGSYPTVWTNFTYIVSGLVTPTLGRFAFRYFVEDGGLNGTNSTYIGIDTLVYTPIPEPSTISLLAISSLLLTRRRRR